MFPLVRQVQIATDGAKGCAARLAGTEAPKFEDTEKTLPEILARIDKTVAFLNSVKADQVDGSESRPITLPLRSGELKFDGQSFLLNFALRSEEHTSELQSLMRNSYAVFCLKKTNI